MNCDKLTTVFNCVVTFRRTVTALASDRLIPISVLSECHRCCSVVFFKLLSSLDLFSVIDADAEAYQRLMTFEVMIYSEHNYSTFFTCGFSVTHATFQSSSIIYCSSSIFLICFGGSRCGRQISRLLLFHSYERRGCCRDYSRVFWCFAVHKRERERERCSSKLWLPHILASFGCHSSLIWWFTRFW